MVSKQAQEASVFPHGMMNIAMIIAPTFISNQDKTVYSIVQASFFIHIHQTCFRWIVAC